ncbi:MAG: sulfatase [Verrucomicrobiales bacterium]|nr:sulfatase [Verrucomicrobiales bacterium]
MKRFFTILLSLFATSVFAADRPNILFAISDDQSWPHAGAYGTNWVKTPGFDRVAREGLLFRQAFTPNAKCAPSRACILTGRPSWQLEDAGNHMPFFPQKFPGYVEALDRKGGYYVGYTGKGWAPGKALDAEGKPRQLTGKAYQKHKAKPPAAKISSNDYARNFEDFLADAEDSGKPWCFWYGATEPHRAYEYEAGVKKGGKRLEDIDRVPSFWPDNEIIRNDMLDYAFEIEHFDHHLVRIIEMLEKSDQLNNTLIVVTSDNGMPFPRVKGNAYLYANHLPLAIMWKEGIQKPGRKIDDFVSFIDFAPTFLEVARLAPENSTMASLTGKSLVPIFQSEKEGRIIAERDHVLIGKERHDAGRPNDWGYPIRGIVTDEWLYLRNYEPDRWPAGDPVTGYLNTDGSPTKTWILEARRKGENSHYWDMNFGKLPEEEFYQLQTDPDNVTNLANEEEHQEAKEKLAQQMREELLQQEDPRMDGKGSIFDNYPISTDSSKFYERFMKGEPTKAGWVNPGDFEKENPKDDQ